MSEDATPLADAVPGPRRDHAFPTLTERQMARIAAVGRTRKLAAGEVLVEVGRQDTPFFLVTAGHLEIVQPSSAGETLIVVHGPGQFTGEAALLTGRRALVRARARNAGEVIELSRERLLALVQTDDELGEVLMRAFILRRVELIARGLGDVVLLGSAHSAGTLRVREFLTRNGHPFTYLDLDTEADVQEVLDRFEVGPDDVPVLICRGTLVLRNPSNREVADCLGFNASIDAVHVRDLVVVGAGPAGLAAAVYGASEGLDVLVLEADSPGGQAGSSSKIENYLGFPTGISGQELAARAYAQAGKFGAEIMIAREATGLSCDRTQYAVMLEGGARIRTRSIIIASGATYRRLEVPNLAEFEGSGVYYGATHVEAQLCENDEVVVVGGGNSAGQAAVFLSQVARRVHMLVRGAGLADSMSRYLIRRIEQSPAIALRTGTRMVGLEGEGGLQRVRWECDGKEEAHPIRHVFVMTGAVPSTGWLSACLALDEKGFIRTGAELDADDLAAAEWPLSRPPHLLETSRPGVFAVGDVRAGNVKRVASAVGEGSIAVSFVHQVLRE